MATKKAAAKKPAAKNSGTELVEEDGQFYIVDGKNKTDVGRSRRYAETLLKAATGS